MPLMTKQDYARQRKVSKAYLSKADVKERLAAAMEVDPVTGKQLINSEKADEILKKTADLSRAPLPAQELPAAPAPQLAAAGPAGEDTAPAATSTFHAAKTERERLKLTSEQLDLEERLGNTLEKSKVVDTIIAAGQKLRESLSARNRRLAEKLATMTDPLQIRTLMDEDDRQMLKSVSDDIVRGLSIENTTAQPPH